MSLTPPPESWSITSRIPGVNGIGQRRKTSHLLQGARMFCAAILSRRLVTALSKTLLSLIIIEFSAHRVSADPIPVREAQGAIYVFLVLKSAEGKLLAIGDQINRVEGKTIRSRLTFHFYDGSIDDETSVFTQGSVFRLISDHHIQKGPSFRQPMDMSVDVPSRTVSWHEMKNGKEEAHSQKMDLPSDLANGMLPLIVENYPNGTAELKQSYLAGSSKPRIVNLSTKPDGEESFRVAGTSRRSKKYRLHVEIGGVAGLVAPLIGKQPPDIEMWVTAGQVATFLKMAGALYESGPIWTMELAAPAWPEVTRSSTGNTH